MRGLTFAAFQATSTPLKRSRDSLSSYEGDSVSGKCRVSEASIFMSPLWNLDFLHSADDDASTVDYSKWACVDDNVVNSRYVHTPIRTWAESSTPPPLRKRNATLPSSCKS